MSTQFRALWVEEKQDGVFTRSIVTRTVDDLPPGDVLIRVHFSSLNYKDALSATGKHFSGSRSAAAMPQGGAHASATLPGEKPPPA